MLASASGHAFTLGEVQGAAVLGQPLEVTVAVSAAEGEVVASDCLSAELLFGDVQQLAPRLQLQSPPNPPNGTAAASLLRIRSTAAVNEPIVSMVLRATCGGSHVRRYVLLADFPALALPDSLPTSSMVPSTMPAVRPAAVSTPGAQTLPKITAAQPQAALAVPTVPTTARPTAVAKPKPKPASVKAAQTARAPRTSATALAKRPSALPVLRVAPAQLAANPTPDTGRLMLKLDSDLLILTPSEQAELAARRATLPPLAPEGELLKQSLQLDALQNELTAFKDLTRQNQTTLAALQSQLSQAQAERVPMLWLYLLVGLLLAALAALAWVLRQQQSAKAAWWQPAASDTVATLAPVTRIEPTAADAITRSGLASPLPPAPNVVSAPKPSGPFEPFELSEPSEQSELLGLNAEPLVQAAADLSLDFDLDQLEDSALDPSDASPAQATRPTPLEITSDLNPEAVADLRQQADFFVSLGQAPRAINMLSRHIQQSVSPHPMVFLDLLTLFHTQGMKAEFRQLRLNFNRLFHAVMPDFPAYYQEGQGLLDYPEQLAALVLVWPHREALDLLDACIFRHDLASPAIGFDLAAFRDLLLLRSLLDELIPAEHHLPSPQSVPTTEELTLDYPKPD